MKENIYNISENGIALIKKYEGFSSKLYLCPANIKTIGYGHVVKDHEVLFNLTKEEANDLLLQDLKIYECAVSKLINVFLTQGEFDALVSFCFNLGIASLQRSTLRQKINRDEHDEIEKEFLKWVYINGRVSRGLINRRMAEVELYFS